MKQYKQKCYDGVLPRIEVTADFIEENELRMHRSPDEILEKMKKDGDMFGFTAEILLAHLPWGLAKDYYKPEFVQKVEAGEEQPIEPITDLGETVQDMIDYLNFGLQKALDCRGLSASRTVTKLAAWAWLLGRDDLEAVIKDEGTYNPYGMPSLLKFAENLGITAPASCYEFANKPV